MRHASTSRSIYWFRVFRDFLLCENCWQQVSYSELLLYKVWVLSFLFHYGFVLFLLDLSKLIYPKLYLGAKFTVLHKAFSLSCFALVHRLLWTSWWLLVQLKILGVIQWRNIILNYGVRIRREGWLCALNVACFWSRVSIRKRLLLIF